MYNVNCCTNPLAKMNNYWWYSLDACHFQNAYYWPTTYYVILVFVWYPVHEK